METQNPPRAEDFRRQITHWLSEQGALGKKYETLRAGDLHRTVGGYPSTRHRMPVACSALRKMMEPEDELAPGGPPSGQGASFGVVFHFPRKKLRSVTEVARELGVSNQAIYQKMKDKEIKSEERKSGEKRQLYIPQEELDGYIERKRAEAPIGRSVGLDSHAVVAGLCKKRPIFHSEADFQHALAWELKACDPVLEIRLERRPEGIKDRIYIDVWVTGSGRNTALELKYKTKKMSHIHRGERFELLNQSAQDLGRYDFLKDVKRLEKLVDAGIVEEGWAILLTNDNLYWSTPNNKPVDEEFRVHDGATLSGRRAWSSRASAGTQRGREAAISLRGVYQMRWQSYSKICEGPGGEFKVLAVRVGR